MRRRVKIKKESKAVGQEVGWVKRWLKGRLGGGALGHIKECPNSFLTILLMSV